MADKKSAMYDHASSKRGGDASKKEIKTVEKDTAKKPEVIKGGIASQHKSQRDEMQRRHEIERREMTGSQRDEERQMNARHEAEHAAMGGKDG